MNPRDTRSPASIDRRRAIVHQGNRRVSVPVLTLEGIQELEFHEEKA